jgi:hypothetical protein
MATIRITDTDLVIEMHGMDKFWSLRSQVTIPLVHIRKVEVRPKDAHVSNMKGALRVGSYVPGYVLAGYYYMTAAGGVGPNAAAVFDGLENARHAIEQWPQGGATPRQSSHRDNALEHLARANEAMRAVAAELGVDPTDKGRGWAFYELHDPEKTIGFDVVGESVRRVVIEIQGQTPEEAAAAIEAAARKQQ